MPRLDYERLGNLTFGGLLVATNAVAAAVRAFYLDRFPAPGWFWVISLLGIACGGWLLYVWWSPRSKNFRPTPNRSDVVFDLILGIAIVVGIAWMLATKTMHVQLTLPLIFLLVTQVAWLLMGLWMIVRAILDLKSARRPEDAPGFVEYVKDPEYRKRMQLSQADLDAKFVNFDPDSVPGDDIPDLVDQILLGPPDDYLEGILVRLGQRARPFLMKALYDDRFLATSMYGETVAHQSSLKRIGSLARIGSSSTRPLFHVVDNTRQACLSGNSQNSGDQTLPRSVELKECINENYCLPYTIRRNKCGPTQLMG